MAPRGVLIYRGDYWQCGLVIPKGGIDDIRRRGLDALRGELLRVAPFLRDRVSEVRSWEDVKLLTVEVDRLQQWYRPGLLCFEGWPALGRVPARLIGIGFRPEHVHT